METVKVNTSQHIDIDYPVAGLGERIVGKLIDHAIFLGVMVLYFIVMAVTKMMHNDSIFAITAIIVYAASFVFYDLLCEIFMNGQSIGKRVMKIKVISLNGAQPSLGQYFIRWIFRIIDFSPLTAWIGGFVSVAISDKKQRIGDIVAGTTVIKTVPSTKIHNIAFHPVANDYVPTFENVHLLSDRDVELVHEVLSTYYKTQNSTLVLEMAKKLTAHLSITQVPNGMNELDFLRVIAMDYNQITSRTV
ncbi:MAG: RDD family protein [Flavobacterium sp.]|nr:MAG: RDD family protein [Flavobacterium sp.]